MILKVLFGHDPETFFNQSKKISGSWPKKNFHDHSQSFWKWKFKNYFGHDPESSFRAWSWNILIEKMFRDCARKRTFGIMSKVIFWKK